MPKKTNNFWARSKTKADLIPIHFFCSKPRTAEDREEEPTPQQPTKSTQEYYHLNFFLPLVDHVLAHSKTIFSEEIKDAMLGFYLIPNQLNNLTDVQINRDDKGRIPR